MKLLCDAIFKTAHKTIVQYSRNVGLIFTGILKLCHEYTLLESELCQKIFGAYQKLMGNVEPNECFSSERVMLIYMYEMHTTSKYVRELRSCENSENWKNLVTKIKDISDKKWEASNSNYRYNNLVYDDLSKISFQDINKIKKWCKKNIATGIDKGKEYILLLLFFSLIIDRDSQPVLWCNGYKL